MIHISSNWRETSPGHFACDTRTVEVPPQLRHPALREGATRYGTRAMIHVEDGPMAQRTVKRLQRWVTMVAAKAPPGVSVDRVGWAEQHPDHPDVIVVYETIDIPAEPVR